MLAKLPSLLVLMVLLALASGSCGLRPSSTPLPHDAWYTGPATGEASFWTWSTLEPTRLHEIDPSQALEAEDLLQAVAILQLTGQQAAEFIDRELPSVPGTQPYLVRGHYLQRERGQFVAYISEGRLVVYHGSLGQGPVPMKRQALVLQLDEKPSQVFVACSMAR